MLRKAKTRVFARSTTVAAKWLKFFHPALPASTMVVTPDRKLKPSGRTLLSPAHAPGTPLVA